MKNIEGLEFIEDINQARNTLAFLRGLEERILNSPEYKLLYGKTQMFYDDSGRSRGGHSFNIGQTSGSMASKAFSVVHSDRKEQQPELYEINLAIAETRARVLGYSHDLGHTPLGHDGESVLNKKLEILTAQDRDLKEVVIQGRQEDFEGVRVFDPETGQEYEYEEYQMSKRGDKGIGFEHNEYSAQIFSRIWDSYISDLEEARNKDGLTEVADRLLDGSKSIEKKEMLTTILAHSRSRFPSIPKDFIAQIVRQADKVEYMNYDFEEYSDMGCFPLERTEENQAEYENFMQVVAERAERFGLTVEEVLEYLKMSGEERRTRLEDDMIAEAIIGIEGKDAKGMIDDQMSSMDRAKICAEFKDDTLFYTDEDGKRGLITGNNVERQEVILDRLLQYYVEHVEEIPHEKVYAALKKINPNEQQIGDNEEVVAYDPEKVTRENAYEYLKVYLSSLTNDECERLYQKLARERIDLGKGHGIEPVSKREVDERIAANKKKAEEKKGKDGLTTLERSRRTKRYLPQSILERIERNRIRHREEVELDNQLLLEMEEKDRERETNLFQQEEAQPAIEDGETRRTGDFSELIERVDEEITPEDRAGAKAVLHDLQHERDVYQQYQQDMEDRDLQ